MKITQEIHKLLTDNISGVMDALEYLDDFVTTEHKAHTLSAVAKFTGIPFTHERFEEFFLAVHHLRGVKGATRHNRQRQISWAIDRMAARTFKTGVDKPVQSSLEQLAEAAKIIADTPCSMIDVPEAPERIIDDLPYDCKGHSVDAFAKEFEGKTPEIIHRPSPEFADRCSDIVEACHFIKRLLPEDVTLECTTQMRDRLEAEGVPKLIAYHVVAEAIRFRRVDQRDEIFSDKAKEALELKTPNNGTIEGIVHMLGASTDNEFCKGGVYAKGLPKRLRKLLKRLSTRQSIPDDIQGYKKMRADLIMECHTAPRVYTTAEYIVAECELESDRNTLLNYFGTDYHSIHDTISQAGVKSYTIIAKNTI